MTIRHDGRIQQGNAFVAAPEGGTAVAATTIVSRELKSSKSQVLVIIITTTTATTTTTRVLLSFLTKIFDLSTFSVADTVKPGQRPMGMSPQLANRLAKPSSSLHVPRFAGGAGVLL